MKKIILIIIVFSLIMIANNKSKVNSVIKIEHNPYKYYIIDFKDKVNLKNFKSTMDNIDDKIIKRVYYDNKIYEYSTYDNFIKHLSEDSSLEENIKYLIEGIKINKVLIYTTLYNYNKLYNVVLNM